MAIAEFLPEGGTPQTFQQAFTTGEAFVRPASPAVDIAPQTVDGMRVSLDASKVTAGDTKALTFRIEDAASGAPVTDLEPYLGAGAHLLIVPVGSDGGDPWPSDGRRVRAGRVVRAARPTRRTLQGVDPVSAGRESLDGRFRHRRALAGGSQ